MIARCHRACNRPGYGDEAALNSFWEWLGPEACSRIQAVSMDMRQSYQNSTRRYCPGADLIFHPFHLM